MHTLDVSFYVSVSIPSKDSIKLMDNRPFKPDLLGYTIIRYQKRDIHGKIYIEIKRGDIE